jgi:hypothetical protein
VGSEEGGAVDGWAKGWWVKIRTQPKVMNTEKVVLTCVMSFKDRHSPCRSGLIDNAKSRVL